VLWKLCEWSTRPQVFALEINALLINDVFNKVHIRRGPSEALCRSSNGFSTISAMSAAKNVVSLLARPSTRSLGSSARRNPNSLPVRWQSSRAARNLHQQSARQAQPAVAPVAPAPEQAYPESTNPALSFPCLDAVETRSANLRERRSLSGPEPSYTTGKTLNFYSGEPLLLDWGGILPEFNIAYETWGSLNKDRSNAILLHTGLSASSHAHSTEANPKPGWWEKFIGPGAPLDTSKYFVICTNVIGGCYGSTGPSSIDPKNGEVYATRFPILTMEDMVRAQFRLLDSLGIGKLYASVGSSMGGMQSLAAGVLFSDRVGRIVSISGCARSHPYSIAMRHTQRQGRYFPQAIGTLSKYTVLTVMQCL
jgi:hypothetical protein